MHFISGHTNAGWVTQWVGAGEGLHMNNEPLCPAAVHVVGLLVTGTNLTATLHLNWTNMLVLERFFSCYRLTQNIQTTTGEEWSLRDFILLNVSLKDTVDWRIHRTWQGHAHEMNSPGETWLWLPSLSFVHEQPGSRRPHLKHTEAGVMWHTTDLFNMRLHLSASLPPLAYSMTRYRVFSVSITSNSFTEKQQQTFYCFLILGDVDNRLEHLKGWNRTREQKNDQIQ